MQLSVIILNYNVQHFLELCLQSVKAALVEIDSEIIVVDNNSPDDSCRMIRQKFPDITLIENKTNFGFSKGNNIGVAQANGEYICILNPDTVVAEDSFLKVLSFAKAQKNLGAIGCKLIDGRGNYLPESKRNVPVVKVALLKILGKTKQYYANQLTPNETGKVDVLVGAFMFMKREVYTKINGFDEDYFMYGEDVDLSYRILKLGLDNYYVGDTTILHYKGESTLKDAKYAERFYGAMQIFYRKHFKRNILFDTIVWIGIKFAKVFSVIEAPKEKYTKSYVVFSNESAEKVNYDFPFDFNVISNVNDINSHFEVIFDANTLSFGAIIKHIFFLRKDETLTFKILPKQVSFIIGSNHSKYRGEILQF
jgi:GT2 family glycosyltransferase